MDDEEIQKIINDDNYSFSPCVTAPPVQKNVNRTEMGEITFMYNRGDITLEEARKLIKENKPPNIFEGASLVWGELNE